MDGQILEDVKQKEAGKRQSDEEQRVFYGAIGFEVLIHRIHEAHPNAINSQIRARALLIAFVQRFLEIRGEERGRPLSREAVGSELALHGEKVAREAWMGPIRFERDLCLSPDRDHVKLARSKKRQVHFELQMSRTLGACDRSGHVDPS